MKLPIYYVKGEPDNIVTRTHLLLIETRKCRNKKAQGMFNLEYTGGTTNMLPTVYEYLSTHMSNDTQCFIKSI